MLSYVLLFACVTTSGLATKLKLNLCVECLKSIVLNHSDARATSFAACTTPIPISSHLIRSCRISSRLISLEIAASLVELSIRCCCATLVSMSYEFLNQVSDLHAKRLAFSGTQPTDCSSSRPQSASNLINGSRQLAATSHSPSKRAQVPSSEKLLVVPGTHRLCSEIVQPNTRSRKPAARLRLNLERAGERVNKRMNDASCPQRRYLVT